MTHMLPSAYHVPAALILLVGGLLACFAGFRLFKLVLGIYGFILGALIATSIVGVEQTTWTVVAVVVGLPAVRIQGLFLAVSTLAFAVVAMGWAFQQDYFVGDPSGVSVSRPSIIRTSSCWSAK